MIAQVLFDGLAESYRILDGDGAVSVRLGRATNSNVLQICIVIGQKWRPKLDQVNYFLKSVGIVCGRIYPQKYGHTLRVFKISAVRRILGNMKPYSFLKKEQISAALDYLNGKISGDGLIAIFSHEYELGKRRTRPPTVSAPLTRLELTTPKATRTRVW